MNTAVVILTSYFLGGIVFLAIFDRVTKRIRMRLKGAAIQTWFEMDAASVHLTQRLSMIVFLIVMWLFWPAVLIGASTSQAKKGQTPKTWSRSDVTGAGIRVQIAYWVRKIWCGECPDCHAVLTPLDIWGQYAVCPICKTQFQGIRLKARKEDKHGDKEQTEKRERRERIATRAEEPRDRGREADAMATVADTSLATKMTGNPIGRTILKRANRQRVVDELSKGDITEQIGRLGSLHGTGELPGGKLKSAIMKKAPKEMDKAIKNFRKQGKEVTVDNLCADVKSTLGFLPMCEKVGLDLSWFENLARERMEAHGIR